MNMKYSGSKSPPKDLIYGARVVLETIEAGRQVDKILLGKDTNSELRRDVHALATKKNIPVQQVPAETLNRLVPEGNHQGVAAYTSIVFYVELEDILLSLQDRGETALIVLLDQVSDVRNFGAIARTAECMGAHAIVIPQEGAARINADAMKVSAGALNHLTVSRVQNIQDAVYLLQGYDIKVVACTEKASDSIFEAPLNTPTCLVFGSEDKGISKRILKTADMLASIPMQGKIASLNVSVSVGMVLMEARRQRDYLNT